MNKRLRHVVYGSVLAGLALFVRLGYSNANDECVWNAVTKQCTPDTQLYLQPVAKLDPDQMQLHEAGKNHFNTIWTFAPRLDGVWGMGPFFLANACSGCHINNGRGITTQQLNKPVFQQLVRLSVRKPGTDETMPHPAYDSQLQVFTLEGGVVEPSTGEADVYIRWLPHTVKLADGTEVELRKPELKITNEKFGAIDDSVLKSVRNGPALFGLGYLEAVPEADILAIAAAQKALGFNGRPNYVPDDATFKRKLGRFGWKANQPSINQQVAAAHLGDVGVTTSLYPDQDCTLTQTACYESVSKYAKPELHDQAWNAVNFFMRATEAPRARKHNDPQTERGEKLFADLQCAVCHVPSMKTGSYPALPAIEHLTFAAFTDLLLHDMGPDLADGRPDFKAGGNDWRTAPLWGVGLADRVNGGMFLLHDGRARNVEEAILWHGGEAKKSADSYKRLPAVDRQSLLSFVNSL